jgi:hypothetical protein
VNSVALLQRILKTLDSETYLHITIEGASTCSKMRSGEFGGFAYFITREEVRYMSTWAWLHEAETTKKKEMPNDQPKRPGRHPMPALR